MTIIIKNIELIQNDKYEKWRNFQKNKKGINKAFGIIFGILFVILLCSIFYVNINELNDDSNGLPDGTIEDRTNICTWLMVNQNKCTMNCSSSKSYLYEFAIAEKFIERPQCIEKQFRLIINTPVFTSNVMTEKWFTINENITINELILDLTNITQINGNAFVSNSFKTIEYLELLNVQVYLFQPTTFTGLPNLKSLIIECNKIPLFERNTLQSVSSTLEFYKINTAFSNGTRTFPEHFTSSVTLIALKELILCNNYFPDTVTADSFVGLPNLKLLNLSKTHLELIGEHSFDSISHSIEIIDLSFNNLKTLPPKFFENLLPSSHSNLLLFYTSHNLWHCDCKLKEFQCYRIHYGDNFNDITKCNTPLKHHDTSLELVTLCIESINDTTIATSSTSTTTTTTTTTNTTSTSTSDASTSDVYTSDASTSDASTITTQQSSIQGSTTIVGVITPTPPIPTPTTVLTPPTNATTSL